MIIKKITAVLTSIFAMFTVLFFILAHILAGEGLFFVAAGLALAESLTFLITPSMDVAYLVVVGILVISLIVAIVWLIKIIKIKGRFFDYIQPLIFLFSIGLVLIIVGYRDELSGLYQAEATRLTVFYFMASLLYILAYALHLMVFGLAKTNLSKENLEDAPKQGLTEEDVRLIVQDELTKVKPVVVKETVFKEEVLSEKKTPLVEEVATPDDEQLEKEIGQEPVIDSVIDDVKEEDVEPEPIVEDQDIVSEPSTVDEQPPQEFVRLTFEERIAEFDEDSLEKYAELKAYMLSYGVKSRISSTGDTFRAKRVTYFKITNSGNSGFKVYYKIDLPSYANTTYPLKDASGIKMYEEVPAFMYLKSDLSLKRCKELVDDVMIANGFERKD